jgi:hypothetical protein
MIPFPLFPATGLLPAAYGNRNARHIFAAQWNISRRQTNARFGILFQEILVA